MIKVYYTTVNGPDSQIPGMKVNLHTTTCSEEIANMAFENARGMIGSGLVSIMVEDGEITMVAGGRR